MKGILKSRAIHIITLAILAGLALLIAWQWPQLANKPKDMLAFIGFWVTTYGLTVAIIEIIRLESVSSANLKAATTSHNSLKLQIELQELTSCLEIINSSVSELTNQKAVPAIFISRIKKIYISIFPSKSEDCPHHKNILILNSYQHVRQTRKSKTNNYENYELTENTPLKNNEHPYKRTIEALNIMHDDLARYAASKSQYMPEAT